MSNTYTVAMSRDVQVIMNPTNLCMKAITSEQGGVQQRERHGTPSPVLGCSRLPPMMLLTHAAWSTSSATCVDLCSLLSYHMRTVGTMNSMTSSSVEDVAMDDEFLVSPGAKTSAGLPAIEVANPGVYNRYCSEASKAF